MNEVTKALPKSDRAFELAWAERRLAVRLRWGAFPAALPLCALVTPLNWHFDTKFFTNLAVAICGLAGVYGHFLAARFICPRCGKRFDKPRWWPIPDRCGSCGIVAGTVPSQRAPKRAEGL